MKNTRDISLHLRLVGSLRDIAERAIALQLPFFQCFLVIKSSGNIIRPTTEDVQDFIALRRQHFGALYVHGSYWINLAGIVHNGHHALERELRMAKRLEFTHMILHPGSAKGALHKDQGIDALAKTLNKVLKWEQHIKIVLENSAHGALSIGGDLQDFAQLLAKLDHPEKLLFCVDTAHAYSYGYDIAQAVEREKFIQLLDTTIGISRIALIHLNDTSEICGSKIDKHASTGTGRIGKEALKAFMLDARLASIPVLMELPVLPEDQEQIILDQVRSWHT